MTHPYWYFHNVEQNINEAFDLLHDVNDNKARVIGILSELKELIKKQREDFDKREMQIKCDQIGYFDNVVIEFCIRDSDNEVVELFERKYQDILLNIKMIKDIIRAEQAIQNQNENMVNAKVTMIICEEE